MLGSVPQKGVERKNGEKMGGERMRIIAAWAEAETYYVARLLRMSFYNVRRSI
jgi:hypothetical protein